MPPGLSISPLNSAGLPQVISQHWSKIIMAQNDINNLVIAAIDENNQLRQSRILLDIAIEQFALEDNFQALERIEVLLDEYLSSYNCHFDELRAILGKLKDTLSATDKLCIPKLK